jgi:carboxymethylenebutenolidase
MKDRVVILLSILFLGLCAAGCRPAAVASPKATFITAAYLEFGPPEALCRGKIVAPILDASRHEKRPALLLIHGDRGLTDWEVDQARQFVEDGYVVFAVDLYGGRRPTNDMDAHILSRALSEDEILPTLRTAVDFLTRHNHVRPDCIGVVGWDIGGGYALDAARHDARLKACVDCYGRVVTDAALLTRLEAPVLGIFAGKDPGITDETINAFRKALQLADKKNEIKIFPNSAHGFMHPTSEEADKSADAQAAQEASSAIKAFLASLLKKP